VEFSFIIQGSHVGEAIVGKPNPTPNEVALDWQTSVSEYVKEIKDGMSHYQMVQGNRPLIYLFSPVTLNTKLGGSSTPQNEADIQGLINAVSTLRSAVQNAGLGNPYIVGMEAGGLQAKWFIDNAGFDAISAYRPAFGGVATPSAATGPFYVNLWTNIRKEFLKVQFSGSEDSNPYRQIIPPLMSGADTTTRHVYYLKLGISDFNYSYMEPNAGEFMNHVLSGMYWVVNHPFNTNANSVLIYAWNEHSEGGHIAPVLGKNLDGKNPDRHLLDELKYAIKNWTPPTSK
jgi:hypothetical protein